jgi:glycine hydroxymethyltransferase
VSDSSQFDLGKTASVAYDAALEVIASVEPRIAEATLAVLPRSNWLLSLTPSPSHRSGHQAA